MNQVVIDATPVFPNPSGVGLYTLELISQLAHLSQTRNFELALFYQPRFKQWLKRTPVFPACLHPYAHKYFLPWPTKISEFFLIFAGLFPPLENYLAQQTATFFERPTVVHGTNYSVLPCKNCFRVMTIHDLTFLKFPEFVSTGFYLYSKKIKNCLQWTDAVITVSESSRQDIIQLLRVAPETVFVTPLASRYDQAPLPQSHHQSRISQAYDVQIPFILFVGTIEPRKNILTLLQAYDLLNQRGGLDHHLVLIGQRGWKSEPIFEAMQTSPWATKIHFFDYLDESSLITFYQNAAVFVFPSFYEGFGLPVLEAMSLGCPVIASNSSSIPEVAGDAALLFDPTDVEQLADLIQTVINSSETRHRMIQRGLTQASQFSWQNTALKTLEVYQTNSAF